MRFDKALAIAERYRAELVLYCERIEIAGSIRRRAPEPKDIELVCIPRGQSLEAFADAVNQWPVVKGQPTGKYTQRLLPEGIKLDLFMCRPENWGAIFLIRTGDWQFSKWVMGTLLPRAGYQQEGGYVRRNGLIVPTPEETDVFRLIGRPYIKPEHRNGGSV